MTLSERRDERLSNANETRQCAGRRLVGGHARDQFGSRMTYNAHTATPNPVRGTGPGPEHPRAQGRPWRPTVALRLSAALHAGGAVAAAAQPESWPMIVAALAANHGLLVGASLWPKSRLIGDNIVRLPDAAARRGEIALTFDDGPDPLVTPRVLDILDARGARASFFCVGERAAAFPEIVREIARRGHSVENHSHRHSTRFGWYGLGALRRDVETAQACITEITGRAPEFFRAPFGMRSPLLDPVLARC